MKNISEYKSVKARFTACGKIIAAFAACLMLVLSAFLPLNFIAAFADGQSDNSTVKACVFKFAGYHDKDEDGRLSGYGIEFLNLVSKYSDLDFIYTGYDTPWNWNSEVDADEDGELDETILDMLNSGKIDIVTSVSRNADREEECDFSLPIGRKKTVLSIRSNETRFVRGDYSTYKGENGALMRVGQLTGSSQNEILEKFAEGRFGYVTEDESGNSFVYSDDDALAAALRSGEVDAILSSNLRKTTNEKELDVLEEADFYAVVKKGDPKGILPKINDAIRQMDIDEGDWQNVLFYKYYGPSYSSELSFSARAGVYK